MQQSTGLGTSLAWTQFTTAALWVFAATVPPSLLSVPDAVFEVLAPLLLAGLFSIGAVALITGRTLCRRVLSLGTATCGVLAAAAIALNVLIPTSLSGF